MADHQRNSIYLPLQITAVALLTHIALSWPLWYPESGRIFPMLPVAEIFTSGNEILNGLLIGLLLISTALVFIFPKNTWALPALVVALLLMIAQDLNRLQPWLYFYLLAWALVLADRKHPEAVKKNLQWLLAAVYAWGGLNKLSPYFAEDNFAWFCEAFIWTKELGQFPVLGYAVAIAEFLLAMGLLWPKTRGVFRYLAIGFHGFIVLALSPLGLDWNTIVIPWNLAMAGMVWFLFKPWSIDEGKTPTLLNFQNFNLVSSLILSLAWVFPVLNIFHCWDENLSWKMYSNTQPEASFYSSGTPACPVLKNAWAQFAYDNGRKLLFDDWALSDLKVPMYNSLRTQKQLARYLCDCNGSAQSTGLIRLTVDRWSRTEHWEDFPCDSLNRSH